jgi:hypothetical protein
MSEAQLDQLIQVAAAQDWAYLKQLLLLVKAHQSELEPHVRVLLHATVLPLLQQLSTPRPTQISQAEMLVTSMRQAERIVSLAAIPPTRIGDEVRRDYLQRALAGQFVYAYANSDATCWYLFDTETAIPLLPFQQRRYVLLHVDTATEPYLVIARVRDTQDAVELALPLHIYPAQTELGQSVVAQDTPYYRRRVRAVQALVADTNLLRQDITLWHNATL